MVKQKVTYLQREIAPTTKKKASVHRGEFETEPEKTSESEPLRAF